MKEFYFNLLHLNRITYNTFYWIILIFNLNLLRKKIFLINVKLNYWNFFIIFWNSFLSNSCHAKLLNNKNNKKKIKINILNIWKKNKINQKLNY